MLKEKSLLKKAVNKMDFINALENKDEKALTKMENRVQSTYLAEKLILGLFVLFSVYFIVSLYFLKQGSLSFSALSIFNVILIFKAIKDYLSIDYFIKAKERCKTEVVKETQIPFYLGILKGEEKIKEDVYFFLGLIVLQLLLLIHFNLN